MSQSSSTRQPSNEYTRLALAEAGIDLEDLKNRVNAGTLKKNHLFAGAMNLATNERDVSNASYQFWDGVEKGLDPIKTGRATIEQIASGYQMVKTGSLKVRVGGGSSAPAPAPATVPLNGGTPPAGQDPAPAPAPEPVYVPTAEIVDAVKATFAGVKDGTVVVTGEPDLYVKLWQATPDAVRTGQTSRVLGASLTSVFKDQSLNRLFLSKLAPETREDLLKVLEETAPAIRDANLKDAINATYHTLAHVSPYLGGGWERGVKEIVRKNAVANPEDLDLDAFVAGGETETPAEDLAKATRTHTLGVLATLARSLATEIAKAQASAPAPAQDQPAAILFSTVQDLWPEEVRSFIGSTWGNMGPEGQHKTVAARRAELAKIEEDRAKTFTASEPAGKAPEKGADKS